jgi:hypothetical protein
VAKTIAALQVALDVNSSEFVKKTDEAKRKANELATSFKISGDAATVSSGGLRALSSSVSSFGTQSDSLRTKILALNQETESGTSSKQRFGDVARNTGYQIQDFAVQVGSGQSAVVALGQQLPQLLSSFGTLGVVLGTVAAVAIPALGVAFKAIFGEMKSVEDAHKDLSTAANEFTAANNAAGQSLAQLALIYNAEAGPTLKKLFEQLREISQLKLADEMRGFAQAFSGEGVFETAQRQLSNALNFIKTLQGKFLSLATGSDVFKQDVNIKTSADELANKLGVTNQQAEKLLETLNKYKEGGLPFAVLRNQVMALNIDLEKATKEGRDLLNKLFGGIAAFEQAQQRLTPEQIAAQNEARRRIEQEAAEAKRRAQAKAAEEKRQEESRAAFLDRLRIQELSLKGIPPYQSTETQVIIGRDFKGAEVFLMMEAAKYGKEAEEAARRIIMLQRRIAQQQEMQQQQDRAERFIENAETRLRVLQQSQEQGQKPQYVAMLIEAEKYGKEAVEQTQKLINYMQSLDDAEQTRLETKRQLARMQQEEEKRQREAVQEEMKQRNRVARDLEKARVPQEVFLEEMEQVHQDFKSGRITQHFEADRLLENVQKKFLDATKATKNSLSDLMRMVDRTGEQFTDAFVRMAMTGKIEMGNMVNSIIADLMRMTVKSTITEPLFAFIKTVLPIPGRALGGPVEANQPYLVGEKGPELFVPRFAGTVVANSQMSTGNQTVNNYYINAIDTKSFEDRLLQSNKTVWAAHAYASKSLSPAGRI